MDELLTKLQTALDDVTGKITTTQTSIDTIAAQQADLDSQRAVLDEQLTQYLAIKEDLEQNIQSLEHLIGDYEEGEGDEEESIADDDIINIDDLSSV